MKVAAGKESGGCGKLLQLGASLPVENVQFLAASKDLTEIPHRYVRSDADAADNFIDTGDEEIPVVDLRRLLDPSTFEDEAEKLKFACEEWGFFQLLNHGISDELIEKVKADVADFFRLPLHDKLVFAQEPGSLEGYGQMFVVSEEQKIDWADMMCLFTLPQNQRIMKFWPTHPPTFRETMDKYSVEVRRVAHCILGFMAKNLGLEHDKFINIFKEGQSMRINYYPPCPSAEKVLGLSPHSDTVGLTLLLQVSEVQGLQIRRNGGWLPVKPIPGAFIVNISDSLEIYTNGKYKSIEHRAVVNPKKERISIAAFHCPNSGELIGPLPELVRGKELYKSLSVEELLKLVFSSKLDGKNLLDTMKL